MGCTKKKGSWRMPLWISKQIQIAVRGRSGMGYSRHIISFFVGGRGRCYGTEAATVGQHKDFKFSEGTVVTGVTRIEVQTSRLFRLTDPVNFKFVTCRVGS